jgi:hypothetical protein
MHSTIVSVAGFCHASLGGFNFEKELSDLLRLLDTIASPCFAIVK